jgi:hypothetical protein
MMSMASSAYSTGFARRCGNGTDFSSWARNSPSTPFIIGVSTIPGAIVLTRIPLLARSRAAGRVRPTTPPFEDEYAACPIWPS